MKRPLIAVTLTANLLFGSSAFAHFQELIPSADIVGANDERTVVLDVKFTHPMERGPLMQMKKPVQFGVVVNGQKQDLLSVLKADGKGYKTAYKLGRPSDYIFFIEPAPYWEPAEGKMIVHYTKVVSNFASGDGWDQSVGFPVELDPLVRPYGLWAGNQFRAVVKKDGKVVPFAEVEVEWRNDGSVEAPSDPFVTQVIKADANGMFSYVMPRAGWWGFAALIDGDEEMTSPEGKKVPVELGALMWVKTVEMK